MTSKDMINNMKERGIKFELCNEDDAEQYLLYNSNYMRTACYRKNFKTSMRGIIPAKKYIDLDFAYLQELAEIDSHLRDLIYKMCIDIEHFLKVKILRDIEQNDLEDGYSIVSDFLDKNPTLVTTIAQVSSGMRGENLISKYFDIKIIRKKNTITSYSNCPVWVLVEVITFGSFLKFYSSYYAIYNTQMHINTKLLNFVNSIRNSCAHNQCLLRDLNPHEERTPPIEITSRLRYCDTIEECTRYEKLRCKTILELTVLFYVHSTIVVQKNKDLRKKDIDWLLNTRCNENAHYFKNNKLLSSNFKFICDIFDYFYN